MPVKKVYQSVPTGVVAPPPVRPPPSWEPPRPPTPVPAEDPDEYPSEDGLPMASNIEHALWMIACFRMLLHWFRGRTNVFVGIDLLVYFKRRKKGGSVAPDVFVSFGVPQRKLPSYKVWEQGKPPDVVWEFGSQSTVKGDAREKKEKYRGMGVREYWLVDVDGKYHDRRVQGFELVNGKYVELPWEEGSDGSVTVWSPVLQLEQRFTEGQLRFWDPKTEKYLELPEEEERGAREQAESRAESEALARKESDLARKESDLVRKAAESRAATEAQARKAAESRAATEAQARKESDQARKAAESRAATEAQARKAAESRAATEAQARKEEMRKRKALEAQVAELKANSGSPRDQE